MAELNNNKSMITHLEEIIQKTEDTLSERQKESLQAATELKSKKLWLNQLASALKEIQVSISGKQEQIEPKSPITGFVEGITSSESDIEVCIVISFSNVITAKFIVNT